MNSRRLQEILHLAWRNQEPIIPMSRLWGSITMTGKMWATSFESPFLSPANIGLIWTEQGERGERGGRKAEAQASCLPPQAPSPRAVSQVLPTGTELWS